MVVNVKVLLCETELLLAGKMSMVRKSILSRTSVRILTHVGTKMLKPGRSRGSIHNKNTYYYNANVLFHTSKI